MTLSGVALHVEIAFSAGPYDTSPTWTDVTAYARHVTTKRGRNNEFDRIEAGTCSVTFDNADGRFTPIRAASPSPYQGNILPRKQIRVRAVVGGVSKPMFTGYTERWSLTHPGGGDYAEAVCECADAFKILSTRKVLDFYGENIQRLNPAAYYPLSEPAGTVLFGDRSGHGLPAGVLGHRTSNDQTAAGGPELVPPSTSVSFDPDGAAGGADIDLTGALPAFPFHTDDWSASFWFQLGASYYPGGRTDPPIPGTTDPTPPTSDVPPVPVGPGAGPGGSGGDPGTPPTVDPGTGTIGWDPSSGQVDYDLFERANTTTGLGVATNGQTWSQTGMGLQVTGRRGTGTGDNHDGLLNIGTAEQDFKMDFSGLDGYFEILFQADDFANFFAVQHWPSSGHTTLGVMGDSDWTLYDSAELSVKSSATWQVTYKTAADGIWVRRDDEVVWHWQFDPGSPDPGSTKAGFGIGTEGASVNITVDNFIHPGAVDAWRVTPDTGLPFDVTPGGIASGGFPTIPLTPGACNSVTVQAHNPSGWSAPSLPSACTTNQGAQGVYDSFVRADSTGGFGTASNGSSWSAHYAGGIKENAGYSPQSLGWEMLDIGSRDQDWLMDVRGSDVGTGDGLLWLYFSGKTGSYDYLRLTCSPTGCSQQSSLDVATGAVAWFPNYTLDRYDQYHVQSYDIGSGKFRVCVARAGMILLNEVVDAYGDATWTYAGVGLSGGPYPWGNNHQRAAAFMQANPKRVRGPRATPGVGEASFTCDPPVGVAHPTQYRVKVAGRTVTAATLPIVVDGLTDFAEYSFAMSAKAPDGTWGFDSDEGRVKPGWALKPTINSASRAGSDVIVAYTLGAANSVNVATDHLHAVGGNAQTWDIAPPHTGTLTLTGIYANKVKLWMSGDWADNPCDTISDWRGVV
jgi:hypothetical protein